MGSEVSIDRTITTLSEELVACPLCGGKGYKSELGQMFGFNCSLCRGHRRVVKAITIKYRGIYEENRPKR